MKWDQERTPQFDPHGPAAFDQRRDLGARFAGKLIKVVPRPENQPPERVFVNTDPQDILNLVNGKMLSEQKLIGSPFIGKWMSLSVSVDDVSIHKNSGTIWVDGTKWTFDFDEKWIGHLETLIRGQVINILARINEVKSYRIAFDGCEII